MDGMTRDVVLTRDGTRIHYRRQGPGPSMVLLHGFPQSGHMWRMVMPALAERFTVVAPDLRGYGGREEIYLRYLLRSWSLNPAAIEDEAVQEYVRCFREPGAMRAQFTDYRAGATIDLEQDGADRDQKVAAPTLVLWGAGRAPQSADMLGVWKARCDHVEGHAVPGSGHFIPEEQPAAGVEAILKLRPPTFHAARRVGS